MAPIIPVGGDIGFVLDVLTGNKNMSKPQEDLEQCKRCRLLCCKELMSTVEINDYHPQGYIREILSSMLC